ncbi:MAG: branched-chain amino acid transaminase [Wenzhouxiangellaceae bacterium]
MAIDAPELIWHNGELKPWHEATVHVMAHVLHYGSSVFEGIRAYTTHQGRAIFRLQDHLERLYHSARIHRIEIPYPLETLREACFSVVRDNRQRIDYLRPIAYRGYGSIGVVADDDVPVEMAIAGISWGAYLGATALEQGVTACVTSWQRVAPNTIPAAAKAGGNYLSSQLISMEAKRHGYDEGIGLAPDGTLSEGAGENLFLIKDNTLYTPPQAASILGGITRDTIIKLAGRMGLPVKEMALPREMLYLADEAFFTGTAAEVTPIRQIDGIDIGSGRRGPLTQRLQKAFFGLFDGTTPDQWGWLEPVAAQSREHQDDTTAIAV